MTTLYWQAGPEDDNRVYIEFEGEITDPKIKAALGDLDGLRGGPEDNRGEYVPVRPEHSAELRAAAVVETA